jgi:hypothetical protein
MRPFSVNVHFCTTLGTKPNALTNSRGDAIRGWTHTFHDTFDEVSAEAALPFLCISMLLVLVPKAMQIRRVANDVIDHAFNHDCNQHWHEAAKAVDD